MLDEMTRWNALKFGISYIYENPKLFFLFFISCYFTFSPYECHGLCQHRSGHSLGGKNKVARNKEWKKQLWVFVYIKYGKFWSVSPGHFIKHKPLISEECLARAAWHFFQIRESLKKKKLAAMYSPAFLGNPRAQWPNEVQICAIWGPYLQNCT